MKRVFGGAVALSIVALLAAGCDDGGYDYGDGYRQARRVACGQFASCSTCTPELGCGWCFLGSSGICVDDPSDCPAARMTGWTWEPTGCRVPIDAGAIGIDGSPEVDASSDARVDGG